MTNELIGLFQYFQQQPHINKKYLSKSNLTFHPEEFHEKQQHVASYPIGYNKFTFKLLDKLANAQTKDKSLAQALHGAQLSYFQQMIKSTQTRNVYLEWCWQRKKWLIESQFAEQNVQQQMQKSAALKRQIRKRKAQQLKPLQNS